MILNEYVFFAGIKNIFHLLSIGMMTVGVVAMGMMTVGVVAMGMMIMGVVAMGMMIMGVVAMGMMTMVLNENVFSAVIKNVFHLLSIGVVIMVLNEYIFSAVVKNIFHLLSMGVVMVDNDFVCWLTLLSSRYLLSFRLLNFLCRSRSRFLFCLLCCLFWHL